MVHALDEYYASYGMCSQYIIKAENHEEFFTLARNTYHLLG